LKDCVLTLQQVKDILKAEVLVGNDQMGRVVTSGFGCDLMSDVLAFAPPGALLLTGITNAQVVRAAQMVDAAAVVFVRGKRPLPTEPVLEMAKDIRLPLLTTRYLLYDSCGLLYCAGLKGCTEDGGRQGAE